MPQSQPFMINCAEADAAERIALHPPRRACIVSAGISFREYQEPDWDTLEHAHPHHEIIIHHFEKPTSAEWVFDRRVNREHLVSGSAIILPAQIPHRAMCTEGGSFSILSLDLIQVAQSAYETAVGDRVELVPTVAIADPVIGSLERLLRLELNDTEFCSRLYVESLVTALSVHLLRTYSTQKPKLNARLESASLRQLQPAIDYMHEHLQENLSLDSMAQMLGISRYYFIRIFKQTFGITPYQYLLQHRIERAQCLLKQSKLSLSDIAIECGFANQSHLTNHFKRQLGITPKTFRQKAEQ